MLKLLLTGLIVYVLYRYFFGANSLGSGQRGEDQKINYHDNDRQGGTSGSKDEDYIDYEEVD